MQDLTPVLDNTVLYTVAFRPLLPGESSCADIAS
jgi:hypothetical protein